MRLNYLISLLILIFTVSCEANPLQTLEDPLSIERAKKTYEKMFSGLRTAKSRQGDYKLFWERGWYYELAQGKVLYIPLQYMQPGFLTYEKGEKINTSLMSHLMVQADERGNLAFNIIRSVPDQEQVSAGRHYIKSAPFSGIIFIDDMDGNLAEGFVYKEGNLKGKIITSPENAKVNTTYEVC